MKKKQHYENTVGFEIRAGSLFKVAEIKVETNRMDSTTTSYSFDEVKNALSALFLSPLKAAPTTQRPEVPTETPPTPGATAEQFAFFAALDRALIKYITSHASRLLHADKPSAWRSFQSVNAENAEKYTDFTPAALCEEFMRRVLPQVFSWDLTECEVRMLQLLDLHPEFERVPEGFVHVPWQRRVASCRAPQPNVDFRLVNAADAAPEQMFPPAAPEPAANFALASQQSAPLGLQHHTLVLTQPYKLQQGGYRFNFSQENSALLSAALSNNFELSGCVRLEPKELHKRLRAAKREFEQHARMPENCSDATKLLAKMQKLKQLRETIVDIMSKSYL